MELEKNFKIKWRDRIKNDEVFQRAKENKISSKNFKNRRHSWIGHTIRRNEFAVNIRQGAISGKKRPWENLDYNILSKLPETQLLTVIRQ